MNSEWVPARFLPGTVLITWLPKLQASSSTVQRGHDTETLGVVEGKGRSVTDRSLTRLRSSRAIGEVGSEEGS